MKSTPEADKTKLNFGANNNIRENYFNIDLQPNNPKIHRGDIRNLNQLSIADNSVEEIVATKVIEFLPVNEIGFAIKHWFDKLKTGGTLFIQSYDANILGNKLKYFQLDLTTVNNILYGQNQKSIHALGALEKLAMQIGFSTIEKGYIQDEFFIKMKK